jgi:anaerobic selenocysteine-containing dehydrogenase
MVSVDPYLNETTRHAQVILPPPSPLARSHYDLAFYDLAVRHVARFSPPTLVRQPGQPDEWEVLARLALIAAGQGASADPASLDELVIRQLVGEEVAARFSPLSGRRPEEILAALAPRRGPERILDFLLRSGPYGDHFGRHSGGLSLARLEAEPHGIDLGPLEPRLDEVLRTVSGGIEIAPEPLVADAARLASLLEAGRQPEAATPAPGASASLVLVGRRQLRSNNSWMHNVPSLVRGKPRCTLEVHPVDAARLGLVDGARARVRSRVGEVVAPVAITDDILPGVVCLPHGWGHDRPESGLRVAREHAGVSSNDLADPDSLDPLSGNAVLNGIPVQVDPC